MKFVGDRYKDFVVTKVMAVGELQCVLRELVHVPSGAAVMHIENDDPENLFCLSFQTLPTDSTGAAHILEHTVLCGSKKYPIKDPFFAMTRRSLNTFMNAMTGSDFTCYPASSQVEKDFYNLLEVYLDAVFEPEIKELSFLQEGHRLEFADPKNPKSALEYKGIVFNEMKGSLSSPDTRLWHGMMEYLCPDLPYAYNSGGDPKEIPDLTYEELIAFHRKYYHPSRCLFFFYGNLPLQRHLDFISDKTLKDVNKLPALNPIPLQPRFKEPVYKEMRYPVNEGEALAARTIISFGWLTAPLVEQREVIALTVLDAILMHSDASLLKKKLIGSGLCIQADAFIDVDMSELPYVIVCKGCEKEKADALQQLIKTSLEEIIKEGIPPYMIEAAVHQIEFSRTEITGDGAPFGLTIFMRSALAKQHGCPPENALMIHSLFDSLILQLKDPAYLPGLIKKYLLDNPHMVRIVMRPDPHLAAEENAEEKKRLEKVQASLTEKESAKIIKNTEALAQYQLETENQDLDCLPKVNLEDVPPKAREFLLVQEHFRDLKVFHHECFTNRILYADLMFDLPDIDEEDLPLVQLITTLLPEIGAGNRDYAANLEYIQAYTGGIGVTCSLFVQAENPLLAKPALCIRGKALHRHVDKLFALFKDMLESPRFDEKKRIEDLIHQLHTSLQSNLNRNGLRYAVQLALSGLSMSSYVNEQWHGISYFKTIHEIAKNLEQNSSKLMERLHYLKDKLLYLKAPHLVLSCDSEMQRTLQKESYFGLGDLPGKPFKPWKGSYSPPEIVSQARTIASPVAFTCEAFKTVSYIHPHAPALSISTQLFENRILHQKIREQGGAYGAGASYQAMTGQYYFHSYRDPHIANTINAFDEAIESISEGEFDNYDLEEAKLGIIQHLDTPISPGSRAITSYAWWREGKTHQMRQHYRDQLLSLTPKKVKSTVEKELMPIKDKGVIVTFAGEELIRQENLILDKEKRSLSIQPIL